MSDLWKYNIKTGFWTWINGNQAGDLQSNHENMGIGNNYTYPGARSSSVSFFTNNKLYLFGGRGLNSKDDVEPKTGFLNDLWEYNLNLNIWTWVSGNKLKDQKGVYGGLNKPSDSNIPGARFFGNNWKSYVKNEIYIFGGFGIDSKDSTGHLNDLWLLKIPENITPPSRFVLTNPIILLFIFSGLILVIIISIFLFIFLYVFLSRFERIKIIDNDIQVTEENKDSLYYKNI